MRPTKCIFFGLFILLSSCSKERQAEKFEGTYTISSSSSNSVNVEDLALTSSITITSSPSTQLNFDLLFGGGYTKTLNGNLESWRKATIEPINTIGVMAQGGYELFGGTLTRKGKELILELDIIHYDNPDFPPGTGPENERHMETYIYKKD